MLPVVPTILRAVLGRPLFAVVIGAIAILQAQHVAGSVAERWGSALQVTPRASRSGDGAAFRLLDHP